MFSRLTGLSVSTREERLGDAITEGNCGDDDNSSPVQLQRAESVDELAEEAKKREFDAKDGRPRHDRQGVLHPSESSDPSFK